ncbi:XRE family transcriptional regulator [Oleiagrimonas soli]
MAGLDPSGASTRMNQYERGKHVPNVAMLAQIGRVLSKPVAYFYTMDDRLAEFLAEYEKLPKSKKDKILEIIR